LEIWDSLAIIEYIQVLYPDQTAIADPKRQAIMRTLCAEMHSSFIALRNELPMNCRRTPSAIALSKDCEDDTDRIQALWQYAAQYSDGKGDWLLGSFSMADAMFAPVVLRFSQYQLPLQTAAADYVDRMLAHPAMVEWVAVGRAESMVIQTEER
jgi:glutathione S-transferase